MFGTSLDPFPASAASDAARVSRARSADSLAGLVDLAVQPTVQVALRAVREMLGMDVSYISQIVGGDMVLSDLDGDGESFGMAAGLTIPLEQTYCQRMLDGRIANLIPDVSVEDRLASLPITHAANIGAFATVPLTLTDGRVYGTLCAANHDAKVLDFRALQFLKVLARMLADQLQREDAAREVGKLAALVNAADDAILGVTPAGVLTSWNPACELMFGYRAREAIGQRIVDLVAPPGEELGMRRMLATAAAGEAVHHQSHRRRADGTIIDVSVTVSPIHDEHGEVSFISAVVRDISAQVRRDRYRTVERNVIGALAAANDAAEAALGTLRAVGEGLDCDIAVLWEVDQDADRLTYSSLWVSDQTPAAAFAHSLHERSFTPGQQLPGRIWTTGKAAWIENLADVANSERAAAAAAAGLRSVVGIPVRSAAQVVGVVEFFTSTQTPENPTLLRMGEALIARLADALGRLHAQEAVRDARQALEVRVRERTSELQHALEALDASQIEMVRRLSQAVEFRDEDTGAHIARISALATRIAQRAGLDAEHCGLIQRASPLHDVGKVAIPDRVLLKPGRLTPAERAIIQTHAEIGHQLLDGSTSKVLQLAANIALTHHERYDGTGYPHGLTGENIPIEGRIVAIADVFDALTSDRVYRPAMSVEQALQILRDGRGTHFDSVLLDHFLADLDEPQIDPQTLRG